MVKIWKKQQNLLKRIYNAANLLYWKWQKFNLIYLWQTESSTHKQAILSNSSKTNESTQFAQVLTDYIVENIEHLVSIPSFVNVFLDSLLRTSDQIYPFFETLSRDTNYRDRNNKQTNISTPSGSSVSSISNTGAKSFSPEVTVTETPIQSNDETSRRYQAEQQSARIRATKWEKWSY